MTERPDIEILREAIEYERSAWGTSSKRFRIARGDTEAALARVEARVKEQEEALRPSDGCRCETCVRLRALSADTEAPK